MLTSTVPDQWMVRGASDGELSFQGVSVTGEAGDPGVVTVTVTRSDGTALYTDQATDGSTTSPRTLSLTVNDLSQLDELSCTWTATDPTPDVVLGTTKIAVVGGVYMTIAELEAYEPTTTDYSDADQQWAVIEAAGMIEEWCNRAFVPRLTVERRDGSGDTRLRVTWPNVSDVQWVDVYQTATSTTAFTSAQLAAVVANGRVLHRTDGLQWDAGRQNINLAYEHGFGRPPRDLQRVAATVAKRQLGLSKRTIEERATQYFPAEGGSVMLTTPGQRWDWFTEFAHDNEILKRYKHGARGVL